MLHGFVSKQTQDKLQIQYLRMQRQRLKQQYWYRVLMTSRERDYNPHIGLVIAKPLEALQAYSTKVIL